MSKTKGGSGSNLKANPIPAPVVQNLPVQAAELASPELLATRPWLKYYDPGVPATVNVPDKTLPELLRGAAASYFDETAIIYFGARMTYRQLDRAADQFATGLADIGVKPGDRVALLLPNTPHFVIAYFGALRAGATLVPCNPTYVERELEYQLKDSGAQVIVTLTLFYNRVKAVQPRTQLRRVIVGNIKDYFPPHLKAIFTMAKEKKDGHRVAFKGAGVYEWCEFLETYRPQPPAVKVKPEDVALLQYTGGTTGTPKGAMLTHSNLIANTLMCNSWMGQRPHGEDICLCAIPFFHSYGMTVAMNNSIMAGAAMLLLPRFNVEEVLVAIDHYRPTLFPGVPAMYIALLNHTHLNKYHIDSIEVCLSGASSLPVEVQTRFEAATGAKLVEGYGMTECSPVSHSTPIYGKRKEGSIGIPFPGIDAKIVDLDTGEKELPLGEIGEIVIKGPTVMAGYYGREEETGRTIRNGWLYTGDIARMDEDGFFYIIDRKKDMILSNGFNVYPRDVEEVLFTHPAVLDAVVIGAPNERGDTTVKAFVVLKEGVRATEHEIIEYCRENMARYKAPRAVEFRDALPKTLIGKALRRVLVEEEQRKLETRHQHEEKAAELTEVLKKRQFRLHLPNVPFHRNHTEAKPPKVAS